MPYPLTGSPISAQVVKQFARTVHFTATRTWSPLRPPLAPATGQIWPRGNP